MSIETWLVYLAAVFVLTVTPGPSVLLCMTNAIRGGFWSGAFSAFGSITAVSALMSLSAFGLGAVLAASEVVFQIVKWCGAIYLFYLGVKLLCSKNADGFGVDSAAATDAKKTSLRDYYKQGLMVGFSNPKALVFFGALFPQFLNSTQPQLPQFLVLCATFVVLEAFWLLTYSAFASRIAPWLRSTGKQLLFDRLCGSTFIAAALLLLATKRATSHSAT